MKKKVVERTLVVLMACAVCVGVTSCGNDSAEQPAPQAPAVQPSAPQAPAVQPSAPQTPAPQVPAPQVPVSQEQTAPSTQPSTEPAAAVPPTASVTTSPADDFAELEKLGQLAQKPEADYVAPARAWAGNIFKRKLWVCRIAQRNRRTADLVALTRDARAACSGTDATFGNFYAIAECFKACNSFDEAREALKQARKLAGTAKQVDKVADLLRSMQ